MSRAESARENGKLGGRPPGSPNKITAEIRAVAQRHAPDAFAELARLAREAQSEQTRVAAIKEILDRAYGRPTQPIDGDGQQGGASTSLPEFGIARQAIARRSVSFSERAPCLIVRSNRFSSAREKEPVVLVGRRLDFRLSLSPEL